jgi:hypothetical protein
MLHDLERVRLEESKVSKVEDSYVSYLPDHHDTTLHKQYRIRLVRDVQALGIHRSFLLHRSLELKLRVRTWRVVADNRYAKDVEV